MYHKIILCKQVYESLTSSETGEPWKKVSQHCLFRLVSASGCCVTYLSDRRKMNLHCPRHKDGALSLHHELFGIIYCFWGHHFSRAVHRPSHSLHFILRLNVCFATEINLKSISTSLFHTIFQPIHFSTFLVHFACIYPTPLPRAGCNIKSILLIRVKLVWIKQATSSH